VWPFVPLELRWYGYVLNNYFYRYPDEFADVLKSAILILAVPAYATVGAIVASLRPKNGVGWLCLVLGLIAVLDRWQHTDGTLIDLANIMSVSNSRGTPGHCVSFILS
jgi:hypothetical protein